MSNQRFLKGHITQLFVGLFMAYKLLYFYIRETARAEIDDRDIPEIDLVDWTRDQRRKSKALHEQVSKEFRKSSTSNRFIKLPSWESLEMAIEIMVSWLYDWKDYAQLPYHNVLCVTDSMGYFVFFHYWKRPWTLALLSFVRHVNDRQAFFDCFIRRKSNYQVKAGADALNGNQGSRITSKYTFSSMQGK